MKYFRKALVLQILFFLLLAVPLSSQASKTKGRISLSDYYSFDSEDSDLHVFSGKVRIYRPEDEEPGWFFNLNTRVRGKMLDGSLHEDSPEYKISELWVGYKFPDGKFRAIAGRQYIPEMYNSYIDGINLKYFIKKDIGIGIFGGLAPDKYDSSFNSKFQTLGIYTDIIKESYNLKIGYENLRYKGETDREYLSMKLDSKLRDDLKLNAVTVISKNQLTDDIDLENVNLNLIYSYSKDLRLTAFFNYYRAVKLYSSAKDYFNIDYYDDYFYEFNSLARAGLKANYRIMKNLKIFGSIAYQRRGVDDAEAVRYTGGLSRTDLYGFDLSGRYTHVDNFDSIEDEFRVEANRRLFDKVDASVYVSHELEQVDSSGGFTNNTLTYGSSLYWKINKSYDMFVFAERYQEDDYYNTSIFTKLGYRF